MKVTGDCEGDQQEWGVCGKMKKKNYPTTFDSTVTSRLDVIGVLPPKGR